MIKKHEERGNIGGRGEEEKEEIYRLSCNLHTCVF
jgi:hypothetical protein